MLQSDFASSRIASILPFRLTRLFKPPFVIRPNSTPIHHKPTHNIHDKLFRPVATDPRKSRTPKSLRAVCSTRIAEMRGCFAPEARLTMRVSDRLRLGALNRASSDESTLSTSVTSMGRAVSNLIHSPSRSLLHAAHREGIHLQSRKVSEHMGKLERVGWL